MTFICVNFRYDFVVIGGGSAGATVASRLSEEPRFSVLLLEAGLDEPTGTQIPSFFFNFIGTNIDWQYNTESEDTACLNKDDRKCYWPRGKVCILRTIFNIISFMILHWIVVTNMGHSFDSKFTCIFYVIRIHTKQSSFTIS